MLLFLEELCQLSEVSVWAPHDTASDPGLTQGGVFPAQLNRKVAEVYIPEYLFDEYRRHAGRTVKA